MACKSHPYADISEPPPLHECMASEMKCAYCSVRLDPYPCNGCGKFMTAAEMHDTSETGIWRCGECR